MEGGGDDTELTWGESIEGRGCGCSVYELEWSGDGELFTESSGFTGRCLFLFNVGVVLIVIII